MIVNQWVPAAHKGDAIGDSARRVRTLLRELGHESEIYALTIDDELRGDVRWFADPAAKRGDLTIFHFAMVSPLTAEFARLPGGRILQYHNVTPSHFFAAYDANIFRLTALSREDLKTLVGHTDAALGDSEYNRRELESYGFTNTGVFPIAIDTERITAAPRRPALEAVLRSDGFLNFLFVGRIAPNKKIEDHIKLAEHYKRYVDESYRFIFVGRTDAVPRYFDTIQALLAEYPHATRALPVSRASAGRRSRDLLPHVERLHFAVRARGLLCASARGNGGRCASARLLIDRCSRHAGRGRRAVCAERPRIRR